MTSNQSLFLYSYDIVDCFLEHAIIMCDLCVFNLQELLYFVEKTGTLYVNNKTNKNEAKTN